MMNMCAVAGLASSGIACDAASIFLSALDQAVGTAGDGRAAGVGVELARPRDGRLNQHRGDRRQDDRREQRDRIGASPVVVAPPPKNIANRDIIMMAAASVAATELVRMSRCLTCASSCAEHAFELLVVQHLQDAFGRRHGRMLRIASGRERVRRRLRDDVAARLRQARARGQPRRRSGEADGRDRPPSPRTSGGRSCPRTSTTRSW